MLNNQELLHLVIICIILLTITYDLRVILEGDIGSQSLFWVRGLIPCSTFHTKSLPYTTESIYTMNTYRRMFPFLNADIQ